ncbi:hypothetical protein [Aestuariimicrobium kwangyangense]|uniref:hypothetical protein n=1 Tax=Aestuariimicrobium kwangyangense TaxID=396389 RepID=UPI0003B366BE|nr:hypothetical protein [Aestuariimicrobium kwangyangense]
MLQESMDAYSALSDGQFGIDDATSVAGLGMSALGAFLDPAGALVGAILGPLLDWVAANVSFVKEPLDLLLGDPGEVMQYSQRWQAAAQQLTLASQQQVQDVQNNLQHWSGQAYEAFIKVQVNVNKAFTSSAQLCQSMGNAVQVAGTIVGVLRELVWGLVKELVISLVTNAVIAAAAAIPSFGASLGAYTAWASGKVAMVMGKISMGISKVFSKLSRLTTRIGPLSRMFDQAGAAFARMAARFDVPAGTTPPGGRRTHDPDAPNPAPHPPFGDPEPLGTRPDQPLSATDHPYLQPNGTTPETQALPGAPQPTAVTPADVPVPDGWPPLDQSALNTFDGAPTPETWPAGETRYRVVGDGQYPSGSFWTREPPASDDVLRGDLAVLNEWNGNHGVVAYTPSQDLNVWVGPAGAQPTTGYDPLNPTHLPGGGEQIYVQRGGFPSGDLDDPGRWHVQSTPWSN